MIRFTVLWRKELPGELATLWCDSSQRDEIAAAADQIVPELLIDAHLKGDILLAGQRQLTIGPLTVYFRVDEGDRKVFVEGIQLAKT